MNYKVLYRKYRPSDFESVVGQQYIVKVLKNSILNQNISHAYIFSGPRGTGKTSTAKIFSKAINCSSSTDGSPCGKCLFCQNFEENPDIIEIDAASNNGVDEIRNLIENVKLTPTNGKYKVYIIDEVHMLTQSAFNALLLTLEEPPKHVVFILATTNIENVPITILSRCQRFDFKKIENDDIVHRLREVCDKESIEATDEGLAEIAYLAEGGLRDALSLLDQISKNNEKITIELVEKQIKIVSKKVLQDLLDTIERNDVDVFLSIISNFKDTAVDYKTLIKRLIEVASNRARNIKKTARYERLNFNKYKSIVLDLSELLNRVNINIDVFTMLEMVLLEYFDIDIISNKKSELSVESSEKLTSIENKEIVKNVEVINTHEIDNLKNVRINNCFVNAKKQFLEEMKAKKEILENDSSISGKIKSILLDSQIVASSDTYSILASENDHVASTANKMLDEIENSIKEILNLDIKLIFVTQQDWEIEKKKYIENLKNNIKYSYIEEKGKEAQIEFEINEVFDASKIEIV